MKKFIAIILAMLFMFGCLAGCGPTPVSEDSNVQEAPVVTETTSDNTTELTVGLITLHD